MTAVAIFQAPAGEAIRVVTVDGEPRFVVADLAKMLGYRDASNAARLLRDHQQGYSSVSTPSGQQRMLVTNEAGLNRLILRANTPDADRIQDWITDEVMPSIARTGGYNAPAITVPDMSTPRGQLAVAEMLVEQARKVVEQGERIAALEPAAEAYGVFMDADGTYSFEQVSKMLFEQTGLGRNKLIARLRELSVLEDNNLPYQRYMQHFHVVAHSFEHSDGRRDVSYTTRVRATGPVFILAKVLGRRMRDVAVQPGLIEVAA